MKSILEKTLFFALAALFVACSNDDDPSPVVPEGQDDVIYVLNSGDWKSNNSSLTMYNPTTGEVVQNYFEQQNGRCLGNTANDMIIYGSKMYIAVAGESTIEVATLDAKSIKQIECGAQPRYLAAYGGKVYATYYDGHVARIDTTSLVVDAKVKVGRNPEQLAVCGSKLFVANSGGMDYNTELGYDNTVSVIDLVSFCEVDKIEVALNPANVVSTGDGVFVASYGNYADVPSALQYISKGGATLDAKSIKQIECGAQPRYLAAYGGKVYATYYDGHVARIDTTSLVVDAKVKVGRNPEQLAVCGSKLFVANSGGMDYNTELGYDNTVSVIDLVSFCEVDKIEVALNPANVVSTGDGVFVASYGNYADVPSALQYISKGGVQYVLPYACSQMTEICYNSGTLYGFLSQYDANWNQTVTYISYNPSTGKVESPWIKEEQKPVPYKVCAVGEYVCVTASDYMNDGDVYLYDTDGMLVEEIPAGLNPVKAVVAQ